MEHSSDKQPQYSVQESEIEIVDLDAAPSSAPRPHSTRARSPLAPRFTPRQRRLQLLATTGLILLTLIIIIASYAPTRSAVGNLLSPFFPSPQPTLAPGADRFYVEGAPSWGQLLVDGKLIPSPPRTGVDAPLQLTPGRHSLVWMPRTNLPLRFPTQQCAISVPVKSYDTCIYSQVQYGTQFAWRVRLIAPFPALATLLSDQRQAVLDAVWDALDAAASTTTVQPGELYATSSPQQPVMTAQEPLTARLHFVLDTTPVPGSVCIGPGDGTTGRCVVNGQDCHQFCTAIDPWQFTAPTTSDSWNILLVVRAVWDYTKADGTTVALNQPDSRHAVTDIPTGERLGFEYLARVALTWKDAHWHSELFLPQREQAAQHAMGDIYNPVCAATWSETAPGPTLLPDGINAHTLNWDFVGTTPYAIGCLAVTSSTQGTYQRAVFLHRFGVLLAANNAAHEQWPALPVAGPATHDAVQTLATTLQSLSGDPSIPSLSS